MAEKEKKEEVKAEAPEVKAEAPKGVIVKAAYKGRVGLSETHADHEKHGHEGGEIFVKDQPLRVALTSGVAAAIKAGNLVETNERPGKKEEK